MKSMLALFSAAPITCHSEPTPSKPVTAVAILGVYIFPVLVLVTWCNTCGELTGGTGNRLRHTLSCLA